MILPQHYIRSAPAVCRFLSSLFIVGFGQPARIQWLCPIAAAVGFALFFSIFSQASSKKERFILSTAWFTGVQFLQLSWMTSIEYQGYYILVVYLFLCCGLALQFGWLAALLPKNSLKPLHIFALSAFWTLLEWARLYFICGFSWNPIGMSLGFHPLPMQWASLFGIFGMSFWVMLVNLWALKIWRDRKKLFQSLCIWFFLASMPYLFGALHLNYHIARSDSSSKTLNIALVQTGLLPSEKVLLSKHRESFIPTDAQWEYILKYLHEKKEGSLSIDKWDLIVFPEAVVPRHADEPFFSLENVHGIFSKIYGSDVGNCFPALSVPFAEKKMLQGDEKIYVSNLFWAQTLANLYDSDVVLGLDHFDRQNDKYYNSAFLVSPRKQDVQRYDKKILLPLAEYLPFEWLRPLTKSYGIYEFFSKGEKTPCLAGKSNISVSICYEETFSDAIRKNIKSDSDLLINLTNDGYYPDSLLAEQHFAHARLRTVENGRPLLRACNTGVTAVMDSLGRVVARFSSKGEERKRGVVQCLLVPYRYTTLFSLWGDGGIICVSLGILALFFFKLFSTNH
jgi:apolipoprotein N-acyltransferase